MARAPLRMATSMISLRLQRTGNAQPIDVDFGEKLTPLGAQFGDVIQVPGQPRFKKEKKLRVTATGDSPDTDGYVTFSLEALRVAGITDPRRLKHAMIVGFQRDYNGDTTADEVFQIVDVVHRGHLIGGPLLVQAHFERAHQRNGSM